MPRPSHPPSQGGAQFPWLPLGPRLLSAWRTYELCMEGSYTPQRHDVTFWLHDVACHGCICPGTPLVCVCEREMKYVLIFTAQSQKSGLLASKELTPRCVYTDFTACLHALHLHRCFPSSSYGIRYLHTIKYNKQKILQKIFWHTVAFYKDLWE